MKGYFLTCIALFSIFTSARSEYRPLTPQPSALITLSVANMRKLPDHRSELVSQAIMGTPVAILKEKKGWLYIQTPDSYTGWTEPSSLKPMNKSEQEAWKKSSRIVYQGATGWITGSDKHTVVSDITGGAILVKVEEKNGWTEVRLPDGRTGFLETALTCDFSEFRKEALAITDALIRTAREYVGIPYLWGGSSAKAADCSGFMQSVFFRNGILLLRDASQQATVGTRVETRQGLDLLQPGDLLFFGKKGTGHVTHVALYLGNLEYIHASGKVGIASLDPMAAGYDNGRRKSLLFAGRITGDGHSGWMAVSQHPWY